VALRNQKLDSFMNGCNTGWGMFVISSGGSSTVTISNSTIHNYQKGGIVANEAGTTLTATGNTVLGMGSATGSAQNGIQIGFGATGAIKSNYVADHDWYQSSPTTWSASGILLWGAPKVVVSGNTVVNNQTSIVVENVDTDDLANGTTLTSNHVYGSHIFDAIDVCSNDNTVSGNQVNTADAGGIHIDSECPVGATASGTGNIVKSNTINDACAGLLGDATGNTFGSNTFYNTTYTTLSGDVCPPLVPTVTGIKSLAEPMGLVGGAQSRYVPSPR